MSKLEKELKIGGRSVSQIKGAKQAQYQRLGKMSPNVRKKKCKKGKSCGAACIASSRVCMVDVPNAIAQYIPQVVKDIKDISTKGATTAKEKEYKLRPVSEKDPKQPVVYPGGMKDAKDVENKYATRISNYRKNGQEDLAKREEKRRDDEIARLKQNSQFAEKLVRNVPEGTKVAVQGNGIALQATTKSGHKIELSYNGGDISFKVGKSFEAGKIGDRKAQMEAISTVRRMYDSLMASLPVGTVVWTMAYTGDGKGSLRESALARLGFSKPEFSGDPIYLKKVAPGRVAPSKEEDFDKYKADKQSVYFKEADEADALWYQAIFGVPLN